METSNSEVNLTVDINGKTITETTKPYDRNIFYEI